VACEYQHFNSIEQNLTNIIRQATSDVAVNVSA